MLAQRTLASAKVQPHQKFLSLARSQTPHFSSVRSADQYVSGDIFKHSVQGKVQPAAVFINLSSEPMSQLRIEGIEMSPELLP